MIDGFDYIIDWANIIPSHWKFIKTKYLFRLVTEKAPENNSMELLSLYTDIGVRPRKELEEKGNKASTTDSYWIVKKGDIIVNKLLAWMGAIGISEYDGVTSPAYDILRPKSQLNPYYYNYLFRSGILNDEFRRRSRGIMDMRLRLYFEEFGQIHLPVPPLVEQNALVNYLDKKMKLIDEFITKKQRLISLLNEEKVGIINHAITKGIDAGVPMKQSGIEWFGAIPAHWEVKKLKYLVSGRLQYGANEVAESEDRHSPRYIRITDFGADGRLREDTFRSLPVEVAQEYLLKEGDILFARSGATVGKTFQFKNFSGKACYAGYLIKATPNELMTSDFLYYFTKSNVYENWKDSIFNQATIQNIGADKYNLLPVVVPSICEQIKIANFISDELFRTDCIVKKIEKEIELLTEYKTSLIFEALTGKIKVKASLVEAIDA